MASSFKHVTAFKREEPYFAALPSELHEVILYVEPMSWVPLDVARMHFSAMQQAFPDPAEQVRNGRLSSERTQRVFLETVVRTLKASGQFPVMALLARVPVAFSRLLRNGGAVQVLRVGPKDARLEAHAHPLVETAYIRNSWQGMLEAGLELGVRRCFVRQDVQFTTADRVAFNVSWV